MDRAGDDSYLARESAQGAGSLGLGMALDLAGNDTWRITTKGQGYGSPRGVGLLLDATGDDLFEANDTDITNPSPQSAQHNTSLAQGMGNGPRGPQRSANLSGGIGLLVDLSGKDRYSCGVFCQGSGYFFGHGVLYDGGGDDSYRGVWYVQGAGAHFALGTFIDVDGADAYETVIASSRGLGHDESAGFFVDGGGDDRYTVAQLSNGASSNVGYGFFVDIAGADEYNTVQLHRHGRYGQAVIDGDWVNYQDAEGARAVGLFLDLAGADQYRDAAPEVTNGSTWKLAGSADAKLGVAGPPPEHLGVGRDVE